MFDQTAQAGRRSPLFEPTSEQKSRAQISGFIGYCARHTGHSFPDYAAFERFAIEHYTQMWRLFVLWSGMLCEGSLEPVVTESRCETSRFFPDCNLSYVENLLRIDTAELAAGLPALTAVHADRPAERFTRGELRSRVEALAAALTGLELKPGSRVAIVAANTAGAVLGCLGAAAIGCTVSSGAPEMGVSALVSRLEQTEPELLMIDLPESLAGTGQRLRAKLGELVRALPSLRGVLLLDDGPEPQQLGLPVLRLTQLLGQHRGAQLLWPRLPFNHPLFVLFTSGTTGAPKCLVHGAGGTLLEHLKEHRLHCDLRSGDKLFFQTSTGWMMWNWQLAALACGVELVLYDGPVTGADTLWRVVAEQQVSVFGTSPAYLQICERSGWRPEPALSFAALRAVLSTGSILYPRQQHWLWTHVKPLPIQSISGGTDIIGCFVLGNPLLPAYPGECQCRSLGMDVRALPADTGAEAGVGELVCANPFPSRPLGFLHDPDGRRFHAAYFEQHEGLWTHGDLIEFTAEGSARMHGRSDGVLNVRGIRIGPAEIYRILEGMPEIAESMAVEQVTPDDVSGSRLVLLVVLRQDAQLDSALILRIKRELGRHGSPAHVPELILAVDELPTTHSGKRSERSARDALNGRPLVNAQALRNPECLEALRAHAPGQPDTGQAREPTVSHEPILQAVTRAWERALAVASIDPQDDFFELGGTSIAALKICADLQPRVAHEIPVTLLFKAPTCAAMSAALERSEVLTYQPLWLARRHEGPPPLYIVHGFGGSAMELVAMARELQVNRSVYVIQARGFEQGDQPHQTVEDMAKEYLLRVRELQPHGPYMLAGYSFGGLVAYEMGRMLTEAGEQVERLVLLDTGVHERCWPAAAWGELIWRRLCCHSRAALRVPPWQWVMLVQHLWRSTWTRVQRACLAGTPEDAEGAGLPETVRRVRSSALAAMAAYRPQRCALPVALIRSELAVSRECDPRLIWRGLASQVQVHDVAGDHLTILRPPYLHGLAQQLSRAVETATAAAVGTLTAPGGAAPLSSVPPAAAGVPVSRAAG